jgi:hypothetical protein
VLVECAARAREISADVTGRGGGDKRGARIREKIIIKRKMGKYIVKIKIKKCKKGGEYITEIPPLLRRRERKIIGQCHLVKKIFKRGKEKEENVDV